MFWIMTKNGDLVNLAVASDVKVVNAMDEGSEPFTVRAFFPGSGEGADYTNVFSGTRDQCCAYRSALVAELSGFYGDAGPAFHDVRVPEPAKPGEPDIPF